MSLHKAYLGRLTIANGQTASNILAARELGMARSLIFVNPAAFTAAVTVQVATNETAVAGDMKPLSVAGSDVTLTAAKHQVVDVPPGIEALRALSAGAEGAERVIEVFAVLQIADGS